MPALSFERVCSDRCGLPLERREGLRGASRADHQSQHETECFCAALFQEPMATNKNQHFVPRCYLKAFTRDEGNATIKLFNLDRQRFIPTAPVKNQCSGSYFYGEDPRLENAIQACENQYASLLRSIRESGYRLDDDDKWFLRFFWLVQHLRTEAASKRSVEMAAAASSVIGAPLPSFARESERLC